jgi:predicted nucleic acid-binding protein
MNSRFFLDTNIFVYAIDRSDPLKLRRSTLLIRDAIGTRKGVISYQVVQEFFQVALKRFAQPMTPVDGEQYLATVLSPLLAIHSSEELYVGGLRLQARYRLSWYDALIVQAARQAECSILYSEDFQHGQKFDNLQIVNPFLGS